MSVKRRCGVHDRRSLHEPTTHAMDIMRDGELVHIEVPIQCSCEDKKEGGS